MSDWTPDQPLRADATVAMEDMGYRMQWILGRSDQGMRDAAGPYACIAIAREFAAAYDAYRRDEMSDIPTKADVLALIDRYPTQGVMGYRLHHVLPENMDIVRAYVASSIDPRDVERLERYNTTDDPAVLDGHPFGDWMMAYDVLALSGRGAKEPQ